MNVESKEAAKENMDRCRYHERHFQNWERAIVAQHSSCP
jgi:hypothetical protein